jgi:hypothetical protein
MKSEHRIVALFQKLELPTYRANFGKYHLKRGVHTACSQQPHDVHRERYVDVQMKTLRVKEIKEISEFRDRCEM